MSEILIAGGGGYVGRRLTSFLLDKGYDVAWLEKSKNIPQMRRAKCLLWEDLQNEKSKVFRPSAIIVAANSPDYGQFPAGANATFDANISLVFNLARYAIAKEVQQLIVFSSGSIYEAKVQIDSNHGKIMAPSFYVASKICAEVILQSFRPICNIQIIRLSRPYGPPIDGNSVINRLCLKVLNNSKIVLTSATGPTIQPIYIDDVALSVYALLKNPASRIVDLAGPEAINLRDLLSICESKTNKKAKISIISGYCKDDRKVDLQAFRNEFDLPAFVKLEDGIQYLIQSYMENSSCRS